MIIDNIKSIIADKGYKQCAIAKKAGMTPRELNDLLYGRKIFRADYVIPLCKALDVSPNDLFAQ